MGRRGLRRGEGFLREASLGGAPARPSLSLSFSPHTHHPLHTYVSATRTTYSVLRRETYKKRKKRERGRRGGGAL